MRLHSWSFRSYDKADDSADEIAPRQSSVTAAYSPVSVCCVWPALQIRTVAALIGWQAYTPGW